MMKVKKIAHKLFFNLIRVYVLRQKVPINVLFYLTNKCNKSCAYCQIPEKNQNNEISTQTIIKTIEELRKIGCIRVGLIGGEPLLRKDISKIVDTCKKNNLITDIYTNGKLIEKHILTLKKVDSVILSLDGPENIHDSLRGRGSYKEVLKAIELCKKNNIPMSVITVLTKKKIGVVDYLVKLSNKFNFLINFYACSDTPISHEKAIKNIPSHKELIHTLQQILNLKKKEKNIFNSKTSLKMLIKNKTTKKEHHPMGLFKCWFGVTSFAISNKGEFLSCIHLEGKEKGLNLKNHSIKESLHFLKVPECQKCNIHCGMDYSLIFSLYPEAILNFIKLYFRK